MILTRKSNNNSKNYYFIFVIVHIICLYLILTNFLIHFKYSIRKESIKIINPTYTQNKERPEKLHYFRYREEHIKELNEREKKFSEKKILDEEFKLLNNLGIKPKTDMSNYALLNNHGSSNSSKKNF